MDRLLTAPAAPAYIWHDLYLQVLFETARAKLSTRIRKAELALVHREHELYKSCPEHRRAGSGRDRLEHSVCAANMSRT